MFAVGPLPRVLTEALIGVFFWAATSILLTYICLNVFELFFVFNVNTSPLLKSIYNLFPQMESFCNMDHEAVYKVVRSVIMATSLVPGIASWVHSFLYEGKKKKKSVHT